jgi:hydrogenase expression/formation protein HypD
MDRQNEGKPVVTSGFEPLDLLQSIVMLLRQLRAGEARVENQYKRVVPWEGNRAALKAMAEVFQLRPISNGEASDSSRNRP